MTPAIQVLKRLGIAHTVHRYDLAGDEEVTYGEAVARAIGADPQTVFKTLVAQLHTAELVVAVVPVTRTLDLRALASAAGAKSAEMAKPALAEKSTGYVTGGISPFGQRKKLRTFLDGSAEGFERIYVSAGRRGLQMSLATADLVRCCSAAIVPGLARVTC
ncbi:MAG TPA: Cys-tRNA(Pro) deacylase [Burkholderiales bacterium]|nr:Cys-tRNA(Pro) deacylase [Burkholderiales bacterium]